MEDDLYALLEVATTATAQEISKAYKKKAIVYHPDKWKGDKAEGEAKFHQILQAYEVLADEKARAAYDNVHVIHHAGLVWLTSAGLVCMMRRPSLERSAIRRPSPTAA